MSTTTKTAGKALHWHQLNHHDVIRYAGLLTPEQLGYWVILRSHFYSGGCTPMPIRSAARVLRIKETKAELLELLEGDFGFQLTEDGWSVPELIEQHTEAAVKVQQKRDAGRKGGIRRAVQAGQMVHKTMPKSSDITDEESGDF